MVFADMKNVLAYEGNQPYFVIAEYHLRDIHSEKLKTLISSIVKYSQKEKGNIYYYLNRKNNTGEVTFIEGWKNKRSLGRIGDP